ncbi:MAG TPA: hypothetical protein VGK77_22530 [Candidatus Binatia bacterium]|jgi:hypothetical protein
MRLVNGCSSSRNSVNQNFSRGELPITTATFLVPGKSRKMFSTIPGRSKRTLTAVRVRGEVHIPETSLVHGGDHHGDTGKQTLAMTL